MNYSNSITVQSLDTFGVSDITAMVLFCIDKNKKAGQVIPLISLIYNHGNKIESSPIWSVIIWVTNKIRQLWRRSLICESQVWLQTELDDKKLCYQLLITNAIPEKTNTPRTNISSGDNVFS